MLYINLLLLPHCLEKKNTLAQTDLFAIWFQLAFLFASHVKSPLALYSSVVTNVNISPKHQEVSCLFALRIFSTEEFFFFLTNCTLVPPSRNTSNILFFTEAILKYLRKSHLFTYSYTFIINFSCIHSFYFQMPYVRNIVFICLYMTYFTRQSTLTSNTTYVVANGKISFFIAE